MKSSLPKHALILSFCLAASGCAKDDEAGRRSGSGPGPQKGAATTARATFLDVTAEVGIEFHHFIGNARYYFPEIMGSGCAVLDYDNDGDLDVYAVQGALLNPDQPVNEAICTYRGEGVPRNRLFRNDLERGRLHFTDVTDEAGVGDAGYGMGCATGDYDNDGFVDLYVTNCGPNVLYHNNGDGSFTDVTVGAGVSNSRWGASASFADLNRDGLLDLYLSNYVDWRLENDRACYSSTGVRDYCAPITYKPAPDALFLQRGGGVFEDVSAASGIDRGQGNGLGVVCADFNGDGRTDIYVANDGTPNFLWISQGDIAAPTFEDQALFGGAAVNDSGMSEAGMGVTADDFDADGDPDLFVAHLTRETSTLYVNDGKGLFRDATTEYGLAAITQKSTSFGARWFDYDNDGWLDLFSPNGEVYWQEWAADSPYPYQQVNQLFHRDGVGRFEEVSASAGPHFAVAEVSRGAAYGDLDNDGDVDIVLVNNNGPLRVLRNEVGSESGHWLSIHLEGVRSNRSAIGARIALGLPDGRTLWRRVCSDGSYLSASDMGAHFGLGELTVCGDTVVYWPSGLVERYGGLAADTEVRLREGQGEEQP
ncbi:MAG TPA: CRTAC1 family protein [Phycisphaerae bacterium]|nr:CRTAC1 family protein [Phycisphaerae bacterium]